MSACRCPTFPEVSRDLANQSIKPREQFISLLGLSVQVNTYLMKLHPADVDGDTQEDLEPCDNPVIGSKGPAQCVGAAGATPDYGGAGRVPMFLLLPCFPKFTNLGICFQPAKRHVCGININNWIFRFSVH